MSPPRCVWPKDRVGVIRKLKWNVSLQRQAGDLVIDTTQSRHKTSKFYGPSRTTISKLVQPWIEKYLSTLQLELTETPYLFFSNGDADRVQTSSQWTQTVKSAFARWSPQKIGVPPKTLRASFVTHLRSSDAAPEVLKRATHDRLAKAAFDWCEKEAKKFDVPSLSELPAQPALSGTIVFKRTAEESDDKTAFTARLAWQDNIMYQGALISGFASAIQSRIQFTVPVDGASFDVKLQIPSTVDAASFTLTNLVVASGPRPVAMPPAAAAANSLNANEAGASNDAGGPGSSSAGPADAAAPAAATTNAAATAAAGGGEDASNHATEPAVAESAAEATRATTAAAPIAPRAASTPARGAAAAPMPSPRPKPLPIAVPGTFLATHKPASGKSPQNSVLFSVDIPWDNERFYPRAKLSLHVPPVAKMIQTTLPAQKPSNGVLSVTLTLPKSIGTQPFHVGQLAILSGPKPTTPQRRVPQPVLMPVSAAPPVAQSMPLQMQGLPVAAPAPLQSVVRSTLASADAAAAAAAVEVRSRAAVIAMPVAAAQIPPKPAGNRKVARAPKPTAAAPKRKAAVAPAAAPAPRNVRSRPAAAAAPAAAPAAPVQQQQQTSRFGRQVKTADKFGTRGELDGAASSFQSAPVPRRALPDVSVETSVPAWAIPGSPILFAWGLHAGTRKRFRAKVLKLRPLYPRIVWAAWSNWPSWQRHRGPPQALLRLNLKAWGCRMHSRAAVQHPMIPHREAMSIQSEAAHKLPCSTRLTTQVVEYIATEDGTGTNALQLPEMRTAYLSLDQIEQIHP